MSLSKRKCWYSNNCLHLIKRAVPLLEFKQSKDERVLYKMPSSIVGLVWWVEKFCKFKSYYVLTCIEKFELHFLKAENGFKVNMGLV